MDLGSKENPITHGGPDRRYKFCLCRKCKQVKHCTPNDDFWGKDGQPLLCSDCCGPYGGNSPPVEKETANAPL